MHIISISSHVAYGAVGNRIMVPALEMLGISVTAINTVELPWHPGMNASFGKGIRMVPDDPAFSAMIDNLAKAPWLSSVDGIITGYLGSPKQAAAIAKLVKALKQASPNALYLCDPVIGDHGGLYVPEETAIAIRDQLWPLADIVTPNVFEFGWMTGEKCNGLVEITAAIRRFKKQCVVVTSVGANEHQIGNLLHINGLVSLFSNQIILPTPNGTGDLLAALFFGWTIIGEGSDVALEAAASIVVAAIKHANLNHESSLSPKHLRQFKDQPLAGIFAEKLA